MKFTCEKSLLSNTLSKAARSVSAKSTLPILEGVLIKAEGSEIRITGYNMETGIIAVTEANVESEGEIVVPAKMLVDIVRKLADDIVTVETGEDNVVNIACGLSDFKIMGLEAEQFPKLPEFDKENSFTLKQDMLKSMLGRTLFSVSVNENKIIHTGALFELENGVLNIVALDGFRMAVRREKIESDISVRFVAPAPALRELEHIIDGGEDDVFIEMGGRHIQFTSQNTTILSRLLDGDFLDYKKAIPTGQTIIISSRVKELLECVERVSLLVSDKIKNPVRMIIEENNIKLFLNTALGSAKDSCPCEGNGENTEIGFNHKYLMDALKAAMPDERVKIKLSSSISPLIIEPEDNESYLFMVLPVRLK